MFRHDLNWSSSVLIRTFPVSVCVQHFNQWNESNPACLFELHWLLAFLTWPLLSDLPPHRFPDVCRSRALTCRPGNHFLFRQSWPRWCSPCSPGKWTSSPCRCNLPSDCRGLRTWKGTISLENYFGIIEINLIAFSKSDSYTSISRGYFLDSSKSGGKNIWNHKSVKNTKNTDILHILAAVKSTVCPSTV